MDGKTKTTYKPLVNSESTLRDRRADFTVSQKFGEGRVDFTHSECFLFQNLRGWAGLTFLCKLVH